MVVRFAGRCYAVSVGFCDVFLLEKNNSSRTRSSEVGTAIIKIHLCSKQKTKKKNIY